MAVGLRTFARGAAPHHRTPSVPARVGERGGVKGCALETNWRARARIRRENGSAPETAAGTP